MKVRFLEDCGRSRGLLMDKGTVADLPAEVAAYYLTHGKAEAADKPAPVETATVAPKENAAKRTGRAKPRRK